MSSILSIFGFDPAKHSVKVEVLAGLTTFLTMSYILAENPLMLSDAGMDKGAVFSATVIAAVVGTLIGTAMGAKMMDENGKLHNMNKALMADAVATSVGALCGTSTVTTYVESATGVMEGGRTGLTAFTVAMLFLVSLFFSPLFLMIPSAATTSALFLVGVVMMHPVLHIDFMRFRTGVPCFVTILMMPLTASISEGIVLGLLSYILIKVCTGEGKQLSVSCMY